MSLEKKESMEIISDSAWQSLSQKALPELQARLMQKNHKDLNHEDRKFFQEVMDLLSLLLPSKQDTTVTPNPSENSTPSKDMSDDEAKALLAMMDSPISPSQTAAIEEIPKNNLPPSEPSKFDEEEKEIHSLDLSKEWVENEFQSDPSMMQDFYTNTDELLTNLDDSVLKLESNPEDKETIETIFRAAHTLKGAAGMFGFKSIEALMHRLENLFDLIRKEKLNASSEVVDVVLQGVDTLKQLLNAAKSNNFSGLDLKPLLLQILAIAHGKNPPSGKAPLPKKPTPSATPTPPTASTSSSAGAKASENSSIRVDLEKLDALVNLVGELVADKARFTNIEQEARLQQQGMEIASQISEAMQQFGRHMNAVQEIIMKVRMVPIGSSLNKFPRMVRDISRSLGKEIQVVIEGEDSELDKTIVEQLGDPLIHLIRNACDHGIEDPKTRSSSGKPANGTLHISAKQEGNRILLIIQDDGKGMDPEKIRTKAIEKKLISQDDNLSEEECFNLIFLPGFSTADKVTELSGRGVGMDVVKKQIQKLKGSVEIKSKVGFGTTISIQLPLTLAIVKCLLIRSQHQDFALPLDSVVESLRVNRKDISKLGDMDVIQLRDQVLPLMNLRDILQLSAPQNFTRIEKQKIFIAVLGSGTQKFGIIVDELVSQQEIVIKAMGNLLKKVPCIAGGAVLGKGDVILVLDVIDLQEKFKSRSKSNLDLPTAI